MKSREIECRAEQRETNEPAAVSDSLKRQLPSLTALRGIAALWVVLYHYSVQLFPTLDVTPYTHLVGKGYLAVDMFFMLSGFVMTHVYHQVFSKGVMEHYRSFIVARIARIYPLHVLVLLLFVATAVATQFSASGSNALHAVPLRGPRSVGALVANIFMVQGLDAGKLSWNYPAWSISIEFVAYLLFPFALPAIRRATERAKVAIGGLLFGLLLILALATKDDFNQWDGPLTLLRCLPEFILGTLLYCAYRAAPVGLFLQRDAVTFSILGAIVLSLHFNAPDLLIIGLFGALVLTAVLNSGSFSRCANVVPLVWLGNVSYSLYLIHGFLQFLAGKLLRRVGIQDHADLSSAASLGLMVAMVLTCLSAAHLSYNYIEVGCRQYLRDVLDRRKRRRAIGEPVGETSASLALVQKE
jgi:peptidoglycan/LPS O-acetylase OafA/YrhL